METVTDFFTPAKSGLARGGNTFRFTAEAAGMVHMGLRSGKMRRAVYKTRFLSVVVFALLAAVSPMAAQASGGGLPAPDLGSAANFAVLAGTALTCTDSNVAGPVGVNFTTAFASTRCKMQVQYLSLIHI